MYIFAPYAAPPVPVRPHVPYAHNDTRRPGRFWRRSRLAKRMMNNSALGETRIGPLRTSYPRLISQYETCPCGSISGATRGQTGSDSFLPASPMDSTDSTERYRAEIHTFKAFADAEEHPSERTSRGCPRGRLPVPPLSRSLMSQYFGILVLSNSNSPY